MTKIRGKQLLVAARYPSPDEAEILPAIIIHVEEPRLEEAASIP